MHNAMIAIFIKSFTVKAFSFNFHFYESITVDKCQASPIVIDCKCKALEISRKLKIALHFMRLNKT